MTPLTLETCHDNINSRGVLLTAVHCKNLSFNWKLEGIDVEDSPDSKWIGVSIILSGMKCFDPKNALASVSEGFACDFR